MNIKLTVFTSSVLATIAAAQTPPQAPMQTQDRIQIDAILKPARNLLVGDGPTAVARGDFDGNGFDDFAVALAGTPNAPQQTVVVVLSDALGQHIAGSFAVDLPPRAIAAADLDGDGDTDIATAGHSWSENRHGEHQTSFALLENFGGASFGALRTSDLGVTHGDLQIVAGHFDVSGLDLAITHRYGLQLFMSDASLDFVQTDSFQLHWSDSLSAADIDQDGNDDLVLTSIVGAPHGFVIFGDGAGGLRSTGTGDVLGFPLAGNARSPLRSVDLDADGDLDMVSIQRRIIYNPYDNGHYPLHLTLNPWIDGVADAHSLVIADFNADGRPDLLASSPRRGAVALFLHRGRPFGAEHYFVSTGALGAGDGAGALATGDWNADGHPDVVCANQASGTVSVFMNVGP